MKNLLFSGMMVFTSLQLFAGFGDKLPLRYGKVSPAEFTIQPTGDQASSPAVVLCDYGEIKVTDRTFYTRHTRIKIMNDEGLKYATVEIPYQTRNNHDDIIMLKAETMVMQNGKIIAYKVTPAMIEDKKTDSKWSKKRFTFPKVVPGAILEYTYTIASLDFEKLNTWYFQHEIPTLWSEVRFEVISPYYYLVSYDDNRKLDQDEEMAYGKKLQWLYDTGEKKRRYELGKDNYLLYATNENRYKVWLMNNRKKKIIMRNLPGISPVHTSSRDAYRYPQVRFDLFETIGNLPRTYRPLLLTTHPDYDTRSEMDLMNDATALSGYVKFRLKTWTEFNGILLEQDRFGGYLNKSIGGMKLVDSLSVGNRSQADLLYSVYRYVRNNYTWNGNLSMVASQDFKSFMKTHTGSSAELNLVLVNLLNRQGIKSYPLLIRTSDQDMPEKMFPVKNQFNHVIALAVIDGVNYLLDATSNGEGINRLNNLDIGTEGWIVRKENPGWINIYSPNENSEDQALPVFTLR
jgi:hypothetical protein